MSSSRTKSNAPRSQKKRESEEKNLGKYRWPKGVSGNPNGRPKKRPITELYAAFLDIKIEELPPRIRRRLKNFEGLTLGAAGAFGVFEAMTKGNHSAAKEIREAIEGKSTQRIELTSEGGGPVKVSLVDTVDRIREAYGLSPSPDPADQIADASVSVPEAVDQRSQPKKDSPQE